MTNEQLERLVRAKTGYKGDVTDVVAVMQWGQIALMPLAGGWRANASNSYVCVCSRSAEIAYVAAWMAYFASKDIPFEPLPDWEWDDIGNVNRAMSCDELIIATYDKRHPKADKLRAAIEAVLNSD